MSNYQEVVVYSSEIYLTIAPVGMPCQDSFIVAHRVYTWVKLIIYFLNCRCIVTFNTMEASP